MENEPIEITDEKNPESQDNQEERRLTIAFGDTPATITLTEYVGDTYRQLKLSDGELVRAFATWYGEKEAFDFEQNGTLAADPLEGVVPMEAAS